MSVYSPLSFENIESPDLTLNTNIFNIKPSQPNMQMYAKKGESKNILIVLSNIIGEKTKITILDDTTNKNLKLIDLGFDLEKLVFPLKEYRVYRTEEKPDSYASFPKEPRKIINPRHPDFVDDIEPNVEYYYYSEAVDVKGTKSEPSKILKLEMVQEQDHVFALLETYEFGEGKKDITEKMFEKELIVNPTFLQSAILDSVIGGYIKEGGDGSYSKRLFKESANILESVNPTHKLRVTSKKTRRRFDINTIFSYKEVKEFKELPPGAELVLEEPPPPKLTIEEMSEVIAKEIVEGRPLTPSLGKTVEQVSTLPIDTFSVGNFNINNKGSELGPNGRLFKNQYIISEDGTFQLIFQTDGNLVLYVLKFGVDPINPIPAWDSKTYNKNAQYAELETDGRLAVYDSDGNKVFQTSPSVKENEKPVKLTVGTQKNNFDAIAILNKRGEVVWTPS
jgi:hypothetical protein